MKESAKTCWVLTLGIPGMDNQSLGLAEALGLSFEQKRICPKWPWTHLPSWLCVAPLRSLGAGSDRFDPPWPDIVIGTGRRTVAVALAIKKASGNRTFNIRIQNPYYAYDRFDLIIVPEHDRLSGDRVIQTTASLHTITPARLQAAAEKFSPLFAGLPRPLIAVLIGGNNKCYRLTHEIGRQFGAQLAALSKQTGAGILLTTSRRTGPEVKAALHEALSGIPSYHWDGTGDNPYLGFLALADAIVVTADSVNMVSEACTTGKPVYVLELEGGSEKFRWFHQSMQDKGYTRPFTGVLETWSYPPLDDVGLAAKAVQQRLANADP
ncbi:MAG: mitochondrial fission ELM1 family protein [Methylomicrobium sp.]